jgi:uncharacterized membrane protein
MDTLVAIIFKHDERGAEKALEKLRNLQRDYLLDLDDAVIVTRRKDGKIKIIQSMDLTGVGALTGGLWGLLIGSLFTGPLGMLLIAGASAGFGALIATTEYGFESGFIEQLSKDVQPCCSALFVLIRQMTQDRVLDELGKLNGTLIQTSLPKDIEQKLADALASHQKAA